MTEKARSMNMKKGVLSVFSTLAGAAAGAGVVTYQRIKNQERHLGIIKKNEAILKMFNQWLIIKQEGKSIAAYLKENNFKKIAIYGMSYAGERLLDDLKGTDIEVVYAVDQRADGIFAEVELVTKDEIAQQQEVDAIIVTAIYFFDEIEEELSESVDCPIVSLEDILYEL